MIVASAGGTVVVVVVVVVEVVVVVVVVVVGVVVVVVASVVVSSAAELRLHDTPSNTSATKRRRVLLRGNMVSVSVSTVTRNTTIQNHSLHRRSGGGSPSVGEGGRGAGSQPSPGLPMTPLADTPCP